MPILALGLSSSFGNQIFLQFVKSSDEKDIAYLFNIHYDTFILDATYGIPNRTLREPIVSIIYKVFYNSRFKKLHQEQKLSARTIKRSKSNAF